MQTIKMEKGTLKYAIPPFDGGVFVVPDGVERIGPGAFSNCVDLRTVVFPPSLREIGERAFLGCVALTSVSIPPTVSKVGDAAFRGCASLREVSCDASATEFGTECFGDCLSLREYRDGAANVGRVFPFPKNRAFGVGFPEGEWGRVSLFVGRYAGRGFPSAPPVGPNPVFFAVAEDVDGNEFVYSSVDEWEAVEGALIQANHETVADHFGPIGLNSVFSFRRLSLICGVYLSGMLKWCSDNGIDPDEDVTVEGALAIFREKVPGAYRRLLYVIAHQGDVDCFLSPINQLTDVELASYGKTATETLTFNVR